MVSIDYFRGIKNTEAMDLMGKSTDEKPIEYFESHKIKNASTFYEMDTRKVFLYDEEDNVWIEQ